MCGILCMFGSQTKPRDYFIKKSQKIRHRGPDWSGIYYQDGAVLCHERLSIVGIENGSQPIIYPNKDNPEYVLCVNGEIYNYKDLYKVALYDSATPVTNSDCEVILHLYKEYGTQFLNMLDGIFAFVLYDIKNGKTLVARDSIGIIPLYIGKERGSIYIASEQKCLDDCDYVETFKPGHYSLLNTNDMNIDMTKYYNPKWLTAETKDYEVEDICEKIRNTLTDSVRKRLMCEVPFGVLLSGGLDSSLIASITSKLLNQNKSKFFTSKLHTFSIGLKGAPDLENAKVVADYLGTIHHELHFTIEDGIDAIKHLIYILETPDVTTIRASTPMYLMSRMIKSYGIKMVLSGEGADEIFGGYLYFHNAPNEEEFHSECKKRVSELHEFDCLRANKSTMAWGVEARVPFLDKRFMELCMPITPSLKLKDKKEKWILRKAFADDYYLPDSVLWRQKEQFTDGVGYSWLDSLKEHCINSISDEEFESLKVQFAGDSQPFRDKEAAYYRKIYEELFPARGNVHSRWIPKTQWDGVSYDPSGRAQSVHNSKL